ncbi:glycosyltransferase family 2 protein [Candidatus Parcubacteria bacterium]|nr:glycosyltransferase family 2 protein [Candidatus Parcubacteria bacterium]
MKTFCVIPAYNEEKTIVEVIMRVKPLVDRVVVIDDCSTDKTYSLAKAQGADVLRHIVNRGQGAALATGNEYALGQGADAVVHFDADGQFLANEIKDIISPIIAEECDVVFGSRFLEKRSEIPRLKKNIIMPIARRVNLIFFNIRLTDPQCGFRALSRYALKKIKIRQDGMAHCSEIMIKAFSNDLKIKEVPVTIIYHNFGQKFSGGIRILKDLFLEKIS